MTRSTLRSIHEHVDVTTEAFFGIGREAALPS